MSTIIASSFQGLLDLGPGMRSQTNVLGKPNALRTRSTTTWSGDAAFASANRRHLLPNPPGPVDVAGMTARGDVYRAALDRAHIHALAWLDSVPDRPIGPRQTADEVLAKLATPLPDGPSDPAAVVDLLAEIGDPGLMAMGSGRFYGWVIGGTLPAAMAADWLVSAWDNTPGLRYIAPTAAAAEDAAAGWLLDLLGLPTGSDVGFTTGATMAGFTGLMAGRFQVLADAGRDVNTRGLSGAPAVTTLVGTERHDTIDCALRYLGLGVPVLVAADDQGRIRLDALAAALEQTGGPTILCLQA
jgi:hypothetical protein